MPNRAIAGDSTGGDEAESAPLTVVPSGESVVPTETISEATKMPASPVLHVPVRVLICALLFVALFIAYALRVILSVGIAPISNEFGYTHAQRGVILSSFFLGYVILQIPGGALATRYGGARVLCAGLLFSSLVTLLTPLVASSLPGMVAARALSGLAQAVIYPSVHAIMGAWAPHAEKSMFVTIVWSGAFLGTTFTLPVAGALCAMPEEGSPWLRGWRVVFVLFASLGVAWCALWAALGASSPEHHAMVHPVELRKIRGGASRPPAAAVVEIVPYRRLLTHPAVIAIAVAHTTHNWQYYLLLTWMPEFLREQLGYDLHAAGVASIGPYLSSFIASIAAGALADALIVRGWRRVTVRRWAQLSGEIIPAAALLAAGYMSDARVAVPLLTVAIGLSGVSTAGFGANHLDISPQYAGILLGFANMCATLPGIVAPALVGWIVAEPHNDAAHWRIAFAIAAFISVIGALWYAAYVQTEPISDAYLRGEQDATGGNGSHKAARSPDMRGSAGHDAHGMAVVVRDGDAEGGDSGDEDVTVGAGDRVRLTRPAAASLAAAASGVSSTRPRMAHVA